MREIIFRGKRTDNGEWIEGYLYVISVFTMIKAADGISYEIDKKTVGQFTGLTDKNGKRIFEGDILQARIDESYPENITTVVIKWIDGAFYYCQGDFEPDLIDDSIKDFEVVGNTYDNPELLEQ